MKTVTLEAERRILDSDATHRFVYQILDLSKGLDSPDAARDAEMAAAILAGRDERGALDAVRGFRGSRRGELQGVAFLNQLLRDFRPDWEVIAHVAKRAKEYGLAEHITEPITKAEEA